MALQIPTPDLPLSGLNRAISTGGNLFQQIINPVIQRENAERQWRQHLDSLALQREQLAHARRNDDLQRALLEQQLQRSKNLNDPLYKFHEFQAIQDLIAGKSPGSGGLPMPNEEIGEGLGAFSPQGLEEAQTQAKTTQGQENKGGLNLELFRKNPALRGWFKHEFGSDPLAAVPETPEEKHAGAINQAISIDEAKATRKKLDEIEKTAQALLPYVGKVNTIADILKRKPDLTGRTTQLADFLGLTKDEDVGTFLSAAQALQAHLSKELSSRGGYGIARLVEQAKPNLGKSPAYNTGVIKDLKQSMKDSFEQLKSEYERLSNGKKFPYNFEQYFKEVTGESTQKTGDQSGNRKRLKFNPLTGRLE